MAPSRPPKNPGVPESPTTLAIGGGVASGDKLNELYQRIGSMQQSITYLEGSADDTRKELKLISEKISTAQGTFNTAKYFLGATCIAVWGVIAMWAKHKLGW